MVAEDGGVSLAVDNPYINDTSAIDKSGCSSPLGPERSPQCPGGDGRKGTEEDYDKLVCGKCRAEFSLTDVSLFVQHKEEECAGVLDASVVRSIEEASAVSSGPTSRRYTRSPGEHSRPIW